MKQRDSEHFSSRNLAKYTAVASGTYTPDLNLVNVFRIDASGYDTTIGTPDNARDGQYIRLEIVSAENMDVQFATDYHINGAVIADDTHEDNVLLIMEGYYNADTAKWNMIVLSVLAALMSLFRCNIDRAMANTGTEAKPFISARMETKQFYCGSVKYCTITIEKRMDDLMKDVKDVRPYFVKVFESVTVRLFGIRLRNKEQSWKFD